MSPEAEAERMIAQAKEKRYHSLSLNGLGLASLPRAIGQLVSLRKLDLYDNHLTSIPEAIWELQNLQELAVQSNRLSTISPGLGSLKQLEVLHLYNNELTSLPAEIGQLSELRHLDVENNKLSSLPEQIGQLLRLTVLRLDRNRLTSLPESIGQLRELSMLTLAENDLSCLPTAIRYLATLELLYLHGNQALAIPRQVLGPEIWNANTCPSRASDIFNFYFEPVQSSLRDANEFELQARTMLMNSSTCNVDAAALLERALQCDSERASRIRDEFGFLYSGHMTERMSDAEKRRVEWRRCTWRILGKLNEMRITVPKSEIESDKSSNTDPASRATKLPTSEVITKAGPTDSLPISEDNITYEVSAQSVKQSLAPSTSKSAPAVVERGSESSEQRGEELEQAVIKLLTEFFIIDKEQSRSIIEKLRQQKRGSQFGHDIEFELQSVLSWNSNVRCHVECKNIQGQITPARVMEKIARYEVDNTEIHHWILISPYASPSNDLNHLLEAWRIKRRHRFTIQVWSPDRQVEEFFGLNPTVYDQFYDFSQGIHPRQWSNQKRIEVARKWMEKLKPPLRMSESFEDYVREPLYLCLKQERHEQLDALFQNHVGMLGRSEAGVVLTDRTLEAYVRDWLTADHPSTMFLLGEFGDGKTVFTYILSRKLLREFENDPDTGWLPIRFALRDFSEAGTSSEFLRRRLGLKQAYHAGQ